MYTVTLLLSLLLGMPAQSATDSFNTAILGYVNEFRAQNGKPALVMNEFMVETARRHSRDMASGATPFGHDGFDDRVRIIGNRLGPIHAAAENVAMGQMTAREVVDGWIKSPGHRENMLGDYTLTGIGTARKDDGTIYFTQIFIHP